MYDFLRNGRGRNSLGFPQLWAYMPPSLAGTSCEPSVPVPQVAIPPSRTLANAVPGCGPLLRGPLSRAFECCQPHSRHFRRVANASYRRKPTPVQHPKGYTGEPEYHMPAAWVPGTSCLLSPFLRLP